MDAQEPPLPSPPQKGLPQEAKCRVFCAAALPKQVPTPLFRRLHATTTKGGYRQQAPRWTKRQVKSRVLSGVPRAFGARHVLVPSGLLYRPVARAPEGPFRSLRASKLARNGTATFGAVWLGGLVSGTPYKRDRRGPWLFPAKQTVH